jgi:hypothetical protein
MLDWMVDVKRLKATPNVRRRIQSRTRLGTETVGGKARTSTLVVAATTREQDANFGEPNLEIGLLIKRAIGDASSDATRKVEENRTTDRSMLEAR